MAYEWSCLNLFIQQLLLSVLQWARDHSKSWGYCCEQAKLGPSSHGDIYSKCWGRESNNQKQTMKQDKLKKYEVGVVEKTKDSSVIW